MRISTLRNSASKLCDELAELLNENPADLWASAVNATDTIPEVLYSSTKGAFINETANDFWTAFQSLRAAETQLIRQANAAGDEDDGGPCCGWEDAR